MAVYNIYENLTPVLLSVTVFAGLGTGVGLDRAGLGLGTAGLGLGLTTAGLDYNTDSDCNYTCTSTGHLNILGALRHLLHTQN